MKSIFPLRNYWMDFRFSGNNGNVMSRCTCDGLVVFPCGILHSQEYQYFSSKFCPLCPELFIIVSFLL